MRINPSGEIVFEKGDLVRVTRNKLKSWHAYPTGHKGEVLDWCPDMEEYCGRTVTIAQRICGCKYKIEEDGGFWAWCNTFFEEINYSASELVTEDDGEIDAPSIARFLDSFSVNT